MQYVEKLGRENTQNKNHGCIRRVVSQLWAMWLSYFYNEKNERGGY